MARWNERFLGISALPPDLTAEELEEFFRLTADDIAAIRATRWSKFWVPCALHLGFMRLSGGKLEDIHVLPRNLLKFLGEQVGHQPPSIASLRTLYKRRQTRWEHQAWAMERLGITAHGKRQEQLLFAAVKEASRGTTSIDRLMSVAREWLFERKLLIPAASTIRDICLRAASDTEQSIYQTMCREAPLAQRNEWAELLLQPHRSSRSALEWLQSAPKRRSKKNLTDLFGRIDFLRGMGVDRIDLSSIPKERLQHYARLLQQLRPARFRQLQEPNRTLLLVSFLRVTLGRCADIVIDLARKATSDIYGRASKTVKRQQGEMLVAYHDFYGDIAALAEDNSIRTLEELRQQLRATVREFAPNVFPSHAAAVREQLIEPNRAIRSLVQKLTELDVQGLDNERATAGLKTLGDLYQRGKTELPAGEYNTSKVWKPLIEEEDREVAMRALEVSTLRELNKALRRGSCWVDYSASYVDRDRLLIPQKMWDQQWRRHYAMLRLPRRYEDYLEPLVEALRDGLKNVAEAIEADEIEIENGDVSLHKLKAEGEPAEVTKAQTQIVDEIGVIQLPELMLQMDVPTCYSTALLGRAPATERELLLTYAAVLAHGTEMTAAGVSRMIPGLSAEDISAAMGRLEFDDALNRANKRVLAYIEQIPIVQLWGDGKSASSDMMSLATSQHLWNARIDPRLQRPAIGAYTHVANWHGVFANRPIVLGERQVGAAIDGVVRQTDIDIEQLSVDTHGYTDVGMALADLLGFALCPRLKNLRERRLYVPRGMEIPEVLKPVTSATLNLDFIVQEWDELVRLAASINNGTTSAVLALQRFGSDAQGDPVYRAGKHLGRLHRTLFLCQYFTNPRFRREMHRVLNRGESVHVLQRAIHYGEVPHDRGRREDEMVAVTGSLTLLCNLAIAWTATRTQEAITALGQRGITYGSEVLRHISPVRHVHINFRGTFKFPFERYLARLLFDGTSASKVRTASR